METLTAEPSKDKVSIGKKKGSDEKEPMKRYPDLTKAKKLSMLDDLLLDSYINAMEGETLKPLELGAIVAYLKMNKEVAEKKEHSESDLIEDLVEDEA